MSSLQSVPDTSDMLQNIMESYTACSCCGRADTIRKIHDGDGYLLMLQCDACHAAFGMDDSMSVAEVQALFLQGNLHQQLPCCDNTDLNEMQIEKFEGNKITVKCMKCSAISVLEDGLQLLATR